MNDQSVENGKNHCEDTLHSCEKLSKGLPSDMQ